MTVKRFDDREQARLRSWAQDFRVELSPDQIHLLTIYLKELWDWNRHMNLTGLATEEGIIKELLLDSLISLPLLPEQGRLLDIGSGAGFPAIPMKICRPGMKLHLVEANSKKVSFLKQVIRITELGEIDVIRGRVENSSGLLCPEGYDIVSARALAHLPQTIAWCAPHLMDGGVLVTFQGRQFENTLKESAYVIRKYGLDLYKSVSYVLPETDCHRNILIFRKNDCRTD